MNKWVAIPVISVLAVGIIVGGYFLWQQTTKLGEAETEIVGLEDNVSSLQGKLTESEATVPTLQAETEKLQADLSTQRTLNSTLSAELKKVKDPRHFASLQELTDWLAKDDTNTKYADVKPSQQLYFILSVRALRDGYLLPVSFHEIDGEYYVDCQAYIGDKIYGVNPSDVVSEMWGNLAPLPPHPLPLD